METLFYGLSKSRRNALLDETSLCQMHVSCVCLALQHNFETNHKFTSLELP